MFGPARREAAPCWHGNRAQQVQNIFHIPSALLYPPRGSIRHFALTIGQFAQNIEIRLLILNNINAF